MRTRAWLPAPIVQLIDRVESRLDRPWSLEAMADEARFSTFHFHRLFRDATGETPSVFFERLRLERAALMLLASDEPITDLALQVGFRRPETFARRFRSHFGVAARDYRKEQLRLWADLGLDAGVDPLGKPGEIRLARLPALKVEVRRSMGDDEGFVFDPAARPWAEVPSGDAPRLGATLDWPGITPPGSVRQDWGRRLDGRATPGWVRRTVGGGLYAVLTVDAPGPVPSTIHQRLFVWAMAGRHRLRPGAILEMHEGDQIIVHQPVMDTQSLDQTTEA